MASMHLKIATPDTIRHEMRSHTCMYVRLYMTEKTETVPLMTIN